MKLTDFFKGYRVLWIIIYLLLLWFILQTISYGQSSNIVINEIMYNPLEKRTDYTEFIELYNNGSTEVDLNGCFLSSAVDYTFSSVNILNPGQYLIVARNIDSLTQLYGPIDSLYGIRLYQWKGVLNNTGELLMLTDRDSNLIDSVRYSSRTPWPKNCNGKGPSLELINPKWNNSLASSWNASNSTAPLGTPGKQNSVYDPLNSLVKDNGKTIWMKTIILHPNYPNPFNPSTHISYTLHKSAEITLKIYNLQGQLIKILVNGRQAAGHKTIVWDGINNAGAKAASGIYIYRLQTADFVQSNKMLLLR